MGCRFCKTNEDIPRTKKRTNTPESERKIFESGISENVPRPLERKSTKKKVSFVPRGANIIDEQSGSKNLEPSGGDEDNKE